MGPHGLHPQALQVADRCAEADDLGDRRGSRLELPRQLVGHEPVTGHVEDHLAPAQERRHGLQQFSTGPQHPHPGRPAHLVAAEGQEVGAQFDHVGGQVGDRLAGVDQAERAHGVRGVGQLAHRGDGPQHVGHRRHPDQFHPVEQTVQAGEVEPPVVGEGDPTQLDAPLGRQLVPGHDVGVVFQFGDQHHVPVGQVVPTPRVGHQVDGFGGVLGEQHLPLRRGTDETLDGPPGVLHGRGGPLGDVVGAAVHVGVDLLVVPGERVEDDPGFLGGGARVQVGEGTAVYFLFEQRKVGLDGGRVEEVGAHGRRLTGRRRSRLVRGVPPPRHRPGPRSVRPGARGRRPVAGVRAVAGSG